MNSYYVYVRTADKVLHRCNIQVDLPLGLPQQESLNKLNTAAVKRFQEIGDPLPPKETYNIRFLADPRNHAMCLD